MRVTALCVVLFACVACFGASQPVASVVSPMGALVGGTSVAAGTAVFTGDTVQASNGGTVLAFKGGTNLVVFKDASVRLTDANSVELMKGMSRIESRTGSLTLLASNWAVSSTPDAKTGRVAADVLRAADGSVSINVKEGQVSAQNKTSHVVEVASAGRPVLLPGTALPPDPQGGQAPAPPTTTTHTSGKTIGAYVIGVAALATAAAVLATRETGVSKSDFQALQAQNTALAGQIAALQTQNTALQAQITSLQNTANTLVAFVKAQNTFNQQQEVLINQITATLSQLTAAQAQLNSIQAQITPLLQIVASGGTLTAAQQTQLASLAAQQATLATTISTLSGTLATELAALQALVPPPSPSFP